MFSPSDMSCSLSVTCCVVIAVLSLQPPVTSLKHKNAVCYQQQECVCEFPTGQGVNLTNLESKPLISNNTVDGVIFYFNPCKDVQSPCPVGSLLCALDVKSNQTVDLGPGHKSVFTSQGLDGPVFLNFENEALKLQTEIELECWDKNETNLVFNNRKDRNEPEDEVKYHLLLQSSEACLKTLDIVKANVDEGLSNGALFFIVLIFVWCAYLLMGAAANHFLRGATGWEMIPHYYFWKNLPTTFMNGLNFVTNGCKSPPSYEQI